MEEQDYKTFHESYMSYNIGTTPRECLYVISVAPVCEFISLWLSSRSQKIPLPCQEFLIVFLIIIFTCTIFSDFDHLVLLTSLFVAFTITLINLDISKLKEILKSEVPKKRAVITNYRAGTNLYSTLCILAVDFSVFPKRFIKTETFGYAVMDLGVGNFICSSGLVEKNSKTPNHFSKLLKSLSVMIFLGAVRLISVKSIDYHEHVGEYGVHWNFFFTLAACRLMSYLISVQTNFANPLGLALVTGLAHQTFLHFGLQEWVLTETPRETFFDANKEGLTSCLGYVSLFFASSSLGRYLTQSKISYGKFVTNLISLSFVFWMCFYLSSGLLGCSRRLFNLGYIFWSLAISSTEMTFSAFGEIILFSLKTPKTEKFEKVSPVIILFESINANGLFFFLFGNLLTGLVNNMFQTLIVEKAVAVAIIVIYMMILCSATYFLYVKKIYLKL